MYKIWFIDDIEENCRTWRNSFSEDIVSECQLDTFNTFPELKSYLTLGNRPQILFVDYYIGDSYGTEVIQYVNTCLKPEEIPVLIAHSSAMDINKNLSNKGLVDFFLRKKKEYGINPEVKQCFGSMLDVRFVIENRHPQEPERFS